MIILWIQKHKAEKQNITVEKEPELFGEHDEAMKKFRHSHTDVNLVPAEDIITADGNLLAPVHWVRLAKNVCN